MSIDRTDVWADLSYALDELESKPRDVHDSLMAAAGLDETRFVQDEKSYNRYMVVISLSHAYSKARTRSNTRSAHEAIEKGLKAILRNSGRSESQVRRRGHELHELLADVQQHNPSAFNDLERCFDSVIQHLEGITSLRYTTNIIEYFEEHGKSDVFVTNRYASIEGGNNAYGMIGLVYQETIRALMSLVLDMTPRDICHRIEGAARKSVLAASNCDPTWDVDEWLDRGPIRPRLEVIQNLQDSRVLRVALRLCERESKSGGVQYWARTLRERLVLARKRARAGKQTSG